MLYPSVVLLEIKAAMNILLLRHAGGGVGAGLSKVAAFPLSPLPIIKVRRRFPPQVQIPTMTITAFLAVIGELIPFLSACLPL